MLIRIVILLMALALPLQPADAKRVALVVGQNAYPGGASARVGLRPLENARNDAASMAALLQRHGFEILPCAGSRSGCFDLDRAGLQGALDELESASKGADLALVYFAGHGLASDQGNILAPTDAKVDCDTGAVTEGVPVERFMQAVRDANASLLILDACRNNPIGAICPGLSGKKLSFTRIEAGQMQRFLLVTSTQFGQIASDGPKGGHSPFATALFKALEANPNVYFEQVLNDVARATYEEAPRVRGIGQIPGKVVGGEAPADCLAGKSCVGDARMAGLAADNERLNAKVRCQARKAAKIHELADTQRKLLSPGPVAEIKLGSDAAPILMVEYCAMWSPWCHIQHKNNMPALRKSYIDTGKVLYIYRDIPNSDTGIETHMLADCMDSSDRSKFLLELYERKENVPITHNPIETAKRLGLTEARIKACLSDDKLRRDVTSLMDGMTRLGIKALPTFFINSERTVGSQDAAFFDAAFMKILAPSAPDAETCD